MIEISSEKKKSKEARENMFRSLSHFFTNFREDEAREDSLKRPEGKEGGSYTDVQVKSFL